MENSNKLFNDHFKIEFNSKGLKSIVNPKDINVMDFILQDDNNYINYKKVFRDRKSKATSKRIYQTWG